MNPELKRSTLNVFRGDSMHCRFCNNALDQVEVKQMHLIVAEAAKEDIVINFAWCSKTFCAENGLGEIKAHRVAKNREAALPQASVGRQFRRVEATA